MWHQTEDDYIDDVMMVMIIWICYSLYDWVMGSHAQEASQILLYFWIMDSYYLNNSNVSFTGRELCARKVGIVIPTWNFLTSLYSQVSALPFGE